MELTYHEPLQVSVPYVVCSIHRNLALELFPVFVASTFSRQRLPAGFKLNNLFSPPIPSSFSHSKGEADYFH